MKTSRLVENSTKKIVRGHFFKRKKKYVLLRFTHRNVAWGVDKNMYLYCKQQFIKKCMFLIKIMGGRQTSV